MFLHIRHLHISHNIPYLPPKILRKHRFQFLLGRLKYPGEMKSKSYAKFGGGGGGGQIRCIMGDVQVAYSFLNAILIKTEQRKKSFANVVRPDRINKPPNVKNLCWKLGMKNKIIGKQ